MRTAGRVCAAIIALAIALCGRSWGLTTTEQVAAVDQRRPAAPTFLRAVDRPDDEGGHVELSWRPPAEATVRQVGLGVSSFTTRAGPDAVHRQSGLFGYRVYRWAGDGAPELVAELAAEASAYVDSTAANNVAYRYDVRAFDGAGESVAQIEPGSAEDLARMASAVDNRLEPVDGQGNPVLGWFDRSDSRVDYNDFFLLVDHFGRVQGEALYEGKYDLDGNGRIDFDDFFIFAGYFGCEVANAPGEG